MEKVPGTILKIFGKIVDGVECKRNAHTLYCGQVNQDAFLSELSLSKLYVVNSIFETFSLTVVEALNCGCSVLVSQYAGITGLLNLTDEDIIYDPFNSEEIANKIMHLLNKPNCDRISRQIDYEKYSFKNMIDGLYFICKNN